MSAGKFFNMDEGIPDLLLLHYSIHNNDNNNNNNKDFCASNVLQTVAFVVA